jgi:ATP-binding protein involved in chromosome partitioning
MQVRRLKSDRRLVTIVNTPFYLSIVSGKGGVGKSTIAANLAIALAEQSLRVGLIDADIYGFSIPAIMGVRSEPDTAASQNRIKPIERHGVKLMSSGFLRQDNQPVVMRGPMLGRVLNTFLNQVDWGELDILLFDMPPGTGDVPLDLHSMLGSGANELIVTTPHDVASEVAFRAGAMTARTGNRLLGVIENMAYLPCPDCGSYINLLGEHGGDRLKESLHSEVWARLPFELQSRTEAGPGIYSDSSETGRQLRIVADRIARLMADEHAAAQ